MKTVSAAPVRPKAMLVIRSGDRGVLGAMVWVGLSGGGKVACFEEWNLAADHYRERTHDERRL
jgi:hypothetical protein